MSLREVAEALNISEQRVYQMDSELEPVMVQRGTKMKTRYYHPAAVERALAARRRGPANPPRRAWELRRAAKRIAARVVLRYAEEAPFFPDVQTDETERVRELLLDVVRGLTERAS